MRKPITLVLLIFLASFIGCSKKENQETFNAPDNIYNVITDNRIDPFVIHQHYGDRIFDIEATDNECCSFIQEELEAFPQDF